MNKADAIKQVADLIADIAAKVRHAENAYEASGELRQLLLIYDDVTRDLQQSHSMIERQIIRHINDHRLLANQGSTERCFFWLSFSQDGRCLGAAIVKANSWPDAVVKTHRLRINPGGDVQVWEMPDTDKARAEIARFGLDRLIPRDELISGGCVPNLVNPCHEVAGGHLEHFEPDV